MESLTISGFITLVIGAVIGVVVTGLAARFTSLYKAHEDFVTSLVMFISGMALLYLVATSKEASGLQLAMAAFSTFLLVASYTLATIKINEHKRARDRHNSNHHHPT